MDTGPGILRKEKHLINMMHSSICIAKEDILTVPQRCWTGGSQYCANDKVSNEDGIGLIGIKNYRSPEITTIDPIFDGHSIRTICGRRLTHNTKLVSHVRYAYTSGTHTQCGTG